MKQQFFLVATKEGTAIITNPIGPLNELIQKGWRADKTYSTNDNYLVLLTYDEEGDVEDEKHGEFDDVEDVRAVEFEQVADYVKKGYLVQTIYAKNCIMTKRKVTGAPEDADDPEPRGVGGVPLGHDEET